MPQAATDGDNEMSDPTPNDTPTPTPSDAAPTGPATPPPESDPKDEQQVDPAGVENAPVPQSDPANAASDAADAALSQADIDAAFGGAGEDQTTGQSAEAATPSSAVEVDTSRVDASGRPFDETAAMMEAAIAEERAASSADSEPLSAPPPGASAPDMPDFGRGAPSAGGDIDLLSDVELNVQIQLGRAQMMIEDVLKLGEGSVVELDKLAGDPVDVLVNDRLVARGEILVLNENFCVRVSEIVAGEADAED